MTVSPTPPQDDVKSMVYSGEDAFVPSENGAGDLRKLAGAVTPKNWRSFGGAKTHAVLCTRTGKEVVMWNGFDSSRTALTDAKRAALADYISAADPANVLALLDERDALVERVGVLECMVQQGGDVERELAAEADGLLAERDALRETVKAMQARLDRWEPSIMATSVSSRQALKGRV